MGLLLSSIKHLRKHWYQFSNNLIQRIQADGIPPNSFYESSSVLVLEPDKILQEKKIPDQYLSWA